MGRERLRERRRRPRAARGATRATRGTAQITQGLASPSPGHARRVTAWARVRAQAGLARAKRQRYFVLILVVQEGVARGGAEFGAALRAQARHAGGEVETVVSQPCELRTDGEEFGRAGSLAAADQHDGHKHQETPTCPT